MDGEVTPEQAEEVLRALVDGGGMDHLDTALALRLLPLAEELGHEDLVERLLNQADAAASDAIEEGWVQLEHLRRGRDADVDALMALGTDAEAMEGGARLAAAAFHHGALLLHAQEAHNEAHAVLGRSLRHRQSVGDEEGTVYGLAARAACEKALGRVDDAIATETERLGLLERLGDDEGVMEALADLAHVHATIGEVDIASDHLKRSYELAKDLQDLSGQLVAGWGLADLAEIAEDWSTAMLQLSDVVHAFMAAGLPAPEPVRERIQHLTALADQA